MKSVVVTNRTVGSMIVMAVSSMVITYEVTMVTRPEKACSGSRRIPGFAGNSKISILKTQGVGLRRTKRAFRINSGEQNGLLDAAG